MSEVLSLKGNRRIYTDCLSDKEYSIFLKIIQEVVAINDSLCYYQ